MPVFVWVQDRCDEATELELSIYVDNVLHMNVAPPESGDVRYAIPPLDAGDHLVRVTVKNLQNNRATMSAQVTVHDDADSDGQTEADGDCDDLDPQVGTGFSELCDGKDNNCNTLGDGEDWDGDGYTVCNDCSDADGTVYVEQLWYADADGDGYGDIGSPSMSCTQPVGYVLDNTDCDDTDSLVYPAAPTEDCSDGRDNDCSGVVDDSPTDNDGDGVLVCDDCDDSDAILTEESYWYDDNDADGYGDPASAAFQCKAPGPEWISDSRDCDDTDAGVSPAAVEQCDGVDEDCDGAADEDAIDMDTWYVDDDSDGFGDPMVYSLSCSPLSGYVSNAADCDDTTYDLAQPIWYLDDDGDGYGTSATVSVECLQPANYSVSAGDCDDTDKTTFPGSSERCDGADNDCDGTIDEAATDAPTWYLDVDSDGYGGTTTTTSCAAPTGYVSNDDDCDDAASTTSPGSAEVCGDDLDNDCDGSIDNADPSAYITFYLDSDGDKSGVPDATTLSCTLPAGYAPTADDCDDTRDDVYPGADEVCDDADNDCDGDTNEGLEDSSEGSVYDFGTIDTSTPSLSISANLHVATDEDEFVWTDDVDSGYYPAYISISGLPVGGTYAVEWVGDGYTVADSSWDGSSIIEFDLNNRVDLQLSISIIDWPSSPEVDGQCVPYTLTVGAYGL